MRYGRKEHRSIDSVYSLWANFFGDRSVRRGIFLNIILVSGKGFGIINNFFLSRFLWSEPASHGLTN